MREGAAQPRQQITPQTGTQDEGQTKKVISTHARSHKLADGERATKRTKPGNPQPRTSTTFVHCLFALQCYSL
jgi:hypothetical protein